MYGPRGRPDMAPYQFVDKISRGVEIQKFGDGSSSRDYTYISDIVDGVIRSIDRPYPYQVFNIGKGDGTSLNDFIGIVEKHTGKIAKIRQLPDQAGDVPYTCASVEKARALLGYEATVPFDEGIGRTVEWYNSQHNIGEAVSIAAATMGTEKTHDTYVLGSSIGTSIIEQTSTAPISASQFEETLMNKCGLSRVVSGNALAHCCAAKRMKVS